MADIASQTIAPRYWIGKSKTENVGDIGFIITGIDINTA
jgi:hypothetical protein